MRHFAHRNTQTGEVIALASGNLAPPALAGCELVELSAEPPPRPLVGYTTFSVEGHRWIQRDPTELEMRFIGVEARSRRDQLLAGSDWTQQPDVALTPQKRDAWGAYRQALRDVTDQPGFPTNIEWPPEPA
jgi:hypothetical protein